MSHFPAKFSKMVIRRAEKKSALFAFYPAILRSGLRAAFLLEIYRRERRDRREIEFQKHLKRFSSAGSAISAVDSTAADFNVFRITAMSPQLV
jgi:hypothetical protein